jgi:hypothetical protein
MDWDSFATGAAAGVLAVIVAVVVIFEAGPWIKWAFQDIRSWYRRRKGSA